MSNEQCSPAPAYSPGVLILVFGDSDSEGAMTGGVAWPAMLVDRVSAAGLPEVTLEAVRFTAAPANAAAYVQRRLEQYGPDVVILPVGAWGFTSEFVEYRVRRLLGARAARWYKRWENRFDHATRKRGAEPAGANRAGRGILRRLVGTAPQVTAEELAKHYEDVFRILARFEDTWVLAMMYPGITRDALPPKVLAVRGRFCARMRRAAESHRFSWLDPEDIFPADVPIRGFAADDLHFNAEGHRRIAEAMAAKLRPLV